VTLLHGRHQAGLPLFDRGGVGWQPWPSSCKEKRDEHDWQGKLAETRTTPHVLHVAHLTISWGVESRMHFSMGSLKCQCVAYQRDSPTVTVKVPSLQLGEGGALGLEMLERLAVHVSVVSIACNPTSLASLGRAWGRTLMSWTSRCNGVHHSVFCRWARIHRPCWQATRPLIGALP